MPLFVHSPPRSSPKSSSVTLWVSAPTEMTSAPASAKARTESFVTPPETSTTTGARWSWTSATPAAICEGFRPTCDVLAPRGEAMLRFAYGQLGTRGGEIIKPVEDLRGQVMFSDARGKTWIRDGFQPPEHYVPGKNEHLVPES